MIRTKVKKILLPTDFSNCSQEAMEYAISLAQVFQAQIFLLHVMELPVFGTDFSLMYRGIPPDLRQDLSEKMQLGVDRMKSLGIEAERDFVIGVPAVEIIKTARKQEADLIVMGTHGRTGLAHVLLGSTAERVIQRAHCPVLTVNAARQPSVPVEKEATVEEQALDTVLPHSGVPG
jgi:nucleotide-binding universal stress UspA family protein